MAAQPPPYQVKKIIMWTSLLKICIFLILLSTVFKKLNSLSKWSDDFVTIGLTLINAFFLFFIFRPICDDALILTVQ